MICVLRSYYYELYPTDEKKFNDFFCWKVKVDYICNKGIFNS